MLRSSRWSSIVVFCSLSIFANAAQMETCHIQDHKELEVDLGSSATLPCHFDNVTDEFVLWEQQSEESTNDHFTNEVLKLKSDGRMLFLSPRDGRVKVYYVQLFEGNFSISIEDLQESDLGSYYCIYRHECFQVELKKKRASSAAMSQDGQFLIYFAAGAVVLMLMFLCGYCIWIQRNKDMYAVHARFSSSNGLTAPEQTQESDNVVFSGFSSRFRASMSFKRVFRSSRKPVNNSPRNLNLDQVALELKPTQGGHGSTNMLPVPSPQMPCSSCKCSPNLQQKNTNQFVYSRNNFPNTWK